MKRRQKRQVMLAAGVLLFLAVGLLAAGALLDRRAQSSDGPVQSQEQTAEASIYYQGQEYRYRRELKNVLLLGVDKSETVTIQDTAGTAGQADVILLLTFDEGKKTAEVMQISRDAMTEVDLYDIDGEYYTSVEAQLAAQYAYGKGGKSSSYAMKQTVSELLFSLPIEGYLTVMVDAISKLNDAIGGVTLTLTEDATEIDPAFLKGRTVTLTGEQAERFIRYRDTDRQGSNEERMRRQVQYMPALLQAVRAYAGADGQYYEALQPLIEEYMVTDLTAERLNELAAYTWEEEQVTYLPGEIRAGEEHEEFHVDDGALQELLIERFYEPVSS